MAMARHVVLIMALCAVCIVPCHMYQETYYSQIKKITRTEFSDAVDKTAMNMLKTVYGSSDNKNLVMSPLGVEMLLALYSRGAGPNSKKEILQFTGATGNERVLNQLTSMKQSLPENVDFFSLDNKAYIETGMELADHFKELSEVQQIDFKKTTEAAAIINKWAENATRGHIKEAVKADDLQEVILGLFNVIYFQGKWHVPFKPEETKDKEFHLDKSNKKKVPMMHLEQHLYYHYSKELEAKIVELPYKEEGFSMIVVLPDEIDGLSKLLEKVSVKGIQEEVFSLYPTDLNVILDLPKFSIKSDHDLNKILPKMGVSSIFTEKANDIVKGTPVKVSKALQKAFIEVNEEGATAGAVTSVLISPLSAVYPPPKDVMFVADRPFLFALRYNEFTLFAGTYSQ